MRKSRTFSDDGSIFSSYTFSCISFYSEYVLCIYKDDYDIDCYECANNGHNIYILYDAKDIRYSILHTRGEGCGWGGRKHILTGVLEIKLG